MLSHLGLIHWTFRTQYQWTLDVHVTVHRDKFLIIKPTRCINFSNLFWNETLHVSDSSSVHHQEFFTVQTTMVYVIQVCRQLLSRIRILLDSCQQTFMTYIIAVCTVKNSWWWTEELSKTCWVSFQNKFEKSVHLAGFIKKICHDAWSHEHKIPTYIADSTRVSILNNAYLPQEYIYFWTLPNLCYFSQTN